MNRYRPTKAYDWYDTDAEFRQLCGDAVSQANGESAQEFANDMMKRANEYGLSTLISDAQIKWLCKLADHIVPKRITRTAS
jgi:hypothetical protein